MHMKKFSIWPKFYENGADKGQKGVRWRSWHTDTDTNTQCIKSMSTDWAYWQFGVYNGVIVYRGCQCGLGICLGVFSWPWSGLLWRGQHFCRSLTRSCVIVLGRKWCHAIVLFPSWDGKWTSEGYRMWCLSVCLSGYKCLLSQWMSGSTERATNTMKCSLS